MEQNEARHSVISKIWLNIEYVRIDGIGTIFLMPYSFGLTFERRTG